MDINGSPFALKAYDSSRLIVSDIPRLVTYNQPVEFTIDASKAGEGQLEVAINDGLVPNQVKALGNSKFLFTFIPKTNDPHLISIKFNGHQIPDFPKECQIFSTDDITTRGPGLSQALLGAQTWFTVDTPHGGSADVQVTVLTPTNEQLNPSTRLTQDGLRVDWVATEVGTYTVQVSFAGNSVPGSPFRVKCYDPKKVVVTPPTVDGAVRKPTRFIIDASRAGEGNLEISVNYSGRNIPNQVNPIGNSRFEVQFTPQEAAMHYCNILFNGEPVPGSPFGVNVMDTQRVVVFGKGLGSVPVNIPASFTILTQNAGAGELKCSIKGPKGELVNIKLFPQASGDYTGEFTPTKTGQHRIDITFANLPVQGSPFFTEVYDPSQVRIGSLPRDLIIGTENTFEINLDNAGNVALEIKITSPTGINVPLKVDEASPRSTIKKVRFTPNETGVHYLNAKFGSEIVPGTPIKMMVNDARIVTAYGDGIHHALHEKSATFMIDTQEMQGDLKVRIEGPNSVIKNTLERTNENLFKVTYVPVEVGFVNISIKWNGKDIVNSPFKAAVTNPERVRIVGGWQSILDSEDRMHIILNEEKKIRFDTSQAGPGTLKADIRGATDGLRVPSRIDQQGAFYTLSFTATREGKYDITITYDGNPLPNMPIRGIAGSTQTNSSEHLKVEVQGRGSYEAKVNEEAEFTIDASKTSTHGSGMPIVRLTGVQSDLEVRIRQIETNVFLCSYIPTAPGAYLLSVTWAERQIRGSPFKVNVSANTKNSNHSASRVICSGDGLRMGIFGKEIKCLIDTRGAGPGELTAYCQGINKTAFCRLFDHRDGTFTLFIKPQESGRHVLTIKYNDEDVPGSPYTLKVSGPPDASKVRVSGPGIEHGVLSTFQSHFICETKGAGAGQLTVKIRGPKGAFRVEMQREHLQDRTIICRYNPSEPGDYLISVKWSDEHVYGSPFHTHIFERQEDLDRFLHEQNAFRLAQQQWREEV